MESIVDIESIDAKTGHELHIPFNVKKGFELKDIEVFVPSSTKKIK